MKRGIKLFALMAIFAFVVCLSNFSLDNEEKKEEVIQDISDFLNFEQTVIELNQNNNIQEEVTPLSYSEDSYLAEEDNDKFVLKRLIVRGDLKETYDAYQVVNYDDLHILCYNTRTETKEAYEKLSEDLNINVFVDQLHKIEEYAEKEYDYDDYENWGAEAIDIGGYLEYLEDNNVNREVVVVVMDTGINTSHPMFKDRLLTDYKGKIKGFSYHDSTYRYSYNNLSFDKDDTSTEIDEEDKKKYSFEDDNSHGTHVAGIIASLTPKNVKILPIKIGGKDGYSSDSIFLSAYERIINIYSKQYDIVSTNLSYSGAGKSSESERDTYNKKCYDPLLNLNIIPVTAAGNENEENNIEGLKAIVVSALEKQGNEYVFDNSYSNYGKIIDISAPGTNILSAGIASTDRGDSSIVSKQGTSMASPQVAGVAALLALNPNLPSDYTSEDIEKMLYDSSLDMGERGKDIYYGQGILNLKYFETEATETLSFYRNGDKIHGVVDNENFETAFDLKIECSDSSYQIIYTTDKSIPGFYSNYYIGDIRVVNTISIYAMGVKIVNGEIVDRTNLYYISYFNSTTPIEECFAITGRGYLTNYTGNFKSLVIPETINGNVVRGLEPSVFKNSNLEYISFPETVNTFGGYVFQGSKNLKYVYAPGVTKIYIAAFFQCESIKFVTDQEPENGAIDGVYLPNLEETVGFSFSGAKSLESVNLSKLTTLGDNGYDFQSTNLKYVYLPLITSIPKGTFNQVASLKGTFEIGKYVTSIGESAFNNTNIEQFKIHSENQNFYTDGLGVYTTNSLITFANGSKNINYSILDYVYIGGRKYIITTVEEQAMQYAQINDLTIPSSINTLKGFSFSQSTIETLHYNAQNCSYLGYYDKVGNWRSAVFNKIGTIEIGKNVVSVPERLFQDVYFDELILNSYSTKLESASFYRMKEQGDLNKLVFNFSENVDLSYARMIINSSILSYSDINYLYSKTKIDEQLLVKFGDFVSEYSDNDYFIYSRYIMTNLYNISSSASSGGTINPSGVNYIYEGESITYTFTPNEGYKVIGVCIDGDCLEGQELDDAIKNGYTFTNVSENHLITVQFKEREYNIEYRDGKGNIISGLLPNSYAYGSEVKLPILDDIEGYIFKGWYTNSNFIGREVSYITSADIGDKVFYAKFDILTYNIMVMNTKNGLISQAANSYDYGSYAIFTITADIGYHIECLIIDGVEYYASSLSQYAFYDIKENHTISAIYAPNSGISYTVRHYQESLTNEGDAVFSDKYYNLIEEIVYFDGTTGELTNVSANSYFGFTARQVDQEIVLGDGSSIVNILYNRNIYHLTIDKTEGIDFVSGDGVYLYGAMVEVRAVVNNDYTWSKWESSDSAVKNSTNTVYTFSMPAVSVQLKAVAVPKKCLIIISSSLNGKITPSNNKSVDCEIGTELQLEANEGYELKKLMINGENKVNNVINNRYRVKNIRERYVVINAVFEEILYKVNLEIIGKGKVVSESDLSRIPYDGNVLLTVLSDDGYFISEVYLDDNLIRLEDNLLELNNVKSNAKVKVVFEKINEERKNDKNGGFSCSKKENSGGGMADFLLVMFTMIGFVFIKKRIYK